MERSFLELLQENGFSGAQVCRRHRNARTKSAGLYVADITAE